MSYKPYFFRVFVRTVLEIIVYSSAVLPFSRFFGNSLHCIDISSEIRYNVYRHIRGGGDERRVCEICGGYFCVPECPMFVGFYVGKGRVTGGCGRCGRLIYPSDKYVRKGEILLCGDCADI